MPYVSPGLKTSRAPPPRKPTHNTPSSPTATTPPTTSSNSSTPSSASTEQDGAAPSHTASVDLGEVLAGRDGDAAVQSAMQAWAGFGAALHRADEAGDGDNDDVGPEDETLRGECAVEDGGATAAAVGVAQVVPREEEEERG